MSRAYPRSERMKVGASSILIPDNGQKQYPGTRLKGPTGKRGMRKKREDA